MRQNVDKPSSVSGAARTRPRPRSRPLARGTADPRLFRSATASACPGDHCKAFADARHAPIMRQHVDNASFRFKSSMHAPARTTRTRAPPHSPRRVRRQSIGRYAIGSCLPRPMRSPGPQQSFRSRTVRSGVPTPCPSCRDASHARLLSSSSRTRWTVHQ
jgi:hypothetical protein